jgi:hypothetical protein
MDLRRLFFMHEIRELKWRFDTDRIAIDIQFFGGSEGAEALGGICGTWPSMLCRAVRTRSHRLFLADTCRHV